MGGITNATERARRGAIAIAALLGAAFAGCGPAPVTLASLDRRATAINDHGVIVGRARFPGSTQEHAFAYDPRTDTLTDLGANLGTDGGNQSVATGINDHGLVSGYIVVPNPADEPPPPVDAAHYLPVVWNLGTGTHTVLSTDGSYIATAINNAGTVIGHNVTQVYPASIGAYRWEPDGTRHELPQLSHYYNRAFPTAINDHGWIVGSQGQSCCGGIAAWLWTPDGNPNGTTTELPGAAPSSNAANGLNNHGQIVGSAWWTATTDPTHRITNTETVPSPPGEDFHQLLDVNDTGVAIGAAGSTDDHAYCVILPSRHLTDLGHRTVTAINNHGDIAGATIDDNNTHHPAIWPPGECAADTTTHTPTPP